MQLKSMWLKQLKLGPAILIYVLSDRVWEEKKKWGFGGRVGKWWKDPAA